MRTKLMYCYLALQLINHWLYSIDIATEQGFRYRELDGKIWVSKNASSCQVFVNQFTCFYWCVRACVCDHFGRSQLDTLYVVLMCAGPNTGLLFSDT